MADGRWPRFTRWLKGLSPLGWVGATLGAAVAMVFVVAAFSATLLGVIDIIQHLCHQMGW